jgi:hypothetical protein
MGAGEKMNIRKTFSVGKITVSIGFVKDIAYGSWLVIGGRFGEQHFIKNRGVFIRIGFERDHAGRAYFVAGRA